MSATVLATMLLALLVLPSTGAAVSLMQTISESDNLTVFAKLLSDTGLANQLAGNATCGAQGATCFLVFAPSDAAFEKAASEASRLLGQLDGRLRLANHHIVTAVGNGQRIHLSNFSTLSHPAAVGLDIGLGQARILPASSGVLFWQARETSGQWSYHANNAVVNVALSNQVAGNGIVHVLDDVALPLSRDISLLAMLNLAGDSDIQRMRVGRTQRLFRHWMTLDAQNQFQYNALLGGGGVRTAFLPTDAAWAALPPALWQRLNASTADAGALRRAILAAHVAPDVCLFTGWLADSQQQPGEATFVKFIAGRFELGKRASHFVRGNGGDFVVVGGVVAGIGVGSNLALSDAVVHSVDRVLAAPGHSSLADTARSLAPDFHSLCVRYEACARVLTSSETETRQWTLFAPVDVSELIDKTMDDVEQILLLHFVRSSSAIPKYNMTDSLVVAAGANNSGQIRFRWSANSTKLWVEGRLAGRGFVRSELLAWDEPTESGHLVHTIRTPLGRPDLTLRQMTTKLPELWAAAGRIDSDGFLPKLGVTGSFTIFVPDNRAMVEMVALTHLEVDSMDGNLSAISMPTDEAALDRALRSLILPNVSILADDAALPMSESHVKYLTSAGADGDNRTATLTIAIQAGTTDRILWLQSANMLVRARASTGQYQCLNGILYTAESVTLHQGTKRAGMQIEHQLAGASGATALMATGLLATVMAALLSILMR